MERADNKSLARLEAVERQLHHAALNQVRVEWKSVADLGLYASGWSDIPVGANTLRDLEFAITRTGAVIFRGACYKAAGSTSIETMFTLPEGYRPPRITRTLIVYHRLSPNVYGVPTITVNTDGTVKTDGVSVYDSYCYFDGVEVRVRDE